MVIPYMDEYSSYNEYKTLDEYKLDRIILSNDIVYGKYINSSNNVFKLHFCEDAIDLLACGYAKQESDLSLYLGYNGESINKISYRHINYVIGLYNTCMLLSIIVIFIFICLLIFDKCLTNCCRNNDSYNYSYERDHDESVSSRRMAAFVIFGPMGLFLPMGRR